MLQIDRHFSTFLVKDMTIEKLQKVATTHVDASFKAKCLRWWNSPAKVKTRTNFPLLFFSGRKSSKTGSTKFLSGLKCIYNFSFFICFFSYFTFLTIGLCYHSWRRGLRLRSHHLKWVFRWHRVGFYRGYFTTRQLCWALEALHFVGQGFSGVFW